LALYGGSAEEATAAPWTAISLSEQKDPPRLQFQQQAGRPRRRPTLKSTVSPALAARRSRRRCPRQDLVLMLNCGHTMPKHPARLAEWLVQRPDSRERVAHSTRALDARQMSCCAHAAIADTSGRNVPWATDPATDVLRPEHPSGALQCPGHLPRQPVTQINKAQNTAVTARPSVAGE